MKPVIQVRGLSKLYEIGAHRPRYGSLRESLTTWAAHPVRTFRDRRDSAHPTIWALKDVSFDVMPGEVVGVIGRNGAGKTTLLKVLSRITEPTEGEVDLYGRVGSLLEVGTGFHPELTGRENVYLSGAVLGMRRREIDSKLEEIVAFAEVEDFVDTAVKHYSSGMYTRLAFAVAAHLEPEILLVDEVLSVGDAAFQRKCLGKMGDVAKGGRTVLFVSHNMEAIRQLCKDVLLIRGGRLCDRGLPEKVIVDYLSDAARSPDGDFDLSSHPARSPSYRPLIQRVSLTSADGGRRAVFGSGETLNIDLQIVATQRITRPLFAAAIEDSSGRRLMTLGSYFHGFQVPEIDGTCTVRCSVERLNLAPGQYLLSVSIATKNDGLLDSVDNAAWFEVTWRDVFGAGVPYHPIFGPILAESRWERIC